MKTQSMLAIPLSNLIRMHGKSAARDAKTLAHSILAPHKSELPAATHKFSIDLFILTMMHLAGDGDNTLKDVTAFITETDHGTEKEMLNILVSSVSHAYTQPEMKKHADQFGKPIQSMSAGAAMRLVAAANYQWRNAFNLPQLPESSPLYYRKEPKRAPNWDLTPSPAQIRINTRFDLADATRIAHKFLAPVQSNTDAPTYAYAGNLLVLVLLATAHEERIPTFNEVLLYLTDPRWDSQRQIINFLGQMSDIGHQKKTIEFRDAWFDKAKVMPDNIQISLIKRSITLWQQAILLKDAPLPATLAKGTAASTNSPANSIQVFNLEAIGRAQTLISECKEDRKGGGERILESAQVNGG
jgi:hypothetical protein